MQLAIKRKQYAILRKHQAAGSEQKAAANVQ